MSEIWKMLKNNCDYEISNTGRVRRRLDRKNFTSWRLLIPYIQKQSVYITLRVNEKNKRFSLKKLMDENWDDHDFDAEYSVVWANSIKNQNIEENERQREKHLGPRKKARKEYYRDPFLSEMRNCAKCGKPSGANYWCDTCGNNFKSEYSHANPSGYSLLISRK